VNFLSRASAILVALRRMAAARRAIIVFFMFLSFIWVWVLLPLYLPVGLLVCLCWLCFQVLEHGAIVPTLFVMCWPGCCCLTPLVRSRLVLWAL